MLHLGVSDEVTNHWYDLVTESAELDIETADIYGTGKQRATGWTAIFYDCSWAMTISEPATLTPLSPASSGN